MADAMDDHDELIIGLLSDDDDRGYKILFDQYYQLLSDILWQLIHDRERGDDIIQEILMSIWLRRYTIKLYKPLSHYLMRAAINRAHNYKRDRSRSKEILTDDFKEFENHVLSAPADTSLEITDIKSLRRHAIQLMRPRSRIVFLLSRKSAMTYKQIAAHLNISVKTVEKHMSKALVVLRDVLKPYLK
jgi:RNA polymerase sigma-70 factor, ECF subfamily